MIFDALGLGEECLRYMYGAYVFSNCIGWKFNPLGSRHLFPQLVPRSSSEINENKRAFLVRNFKECEQQLSWEKNYLEFNKVSPVSERFVWNCIRWYGPISIISHSGVVETCCWKKCSGCTTRPGGHTDMLSCMGIYDMGILKFGYPPNTILFYDFAVVGGRCAFMWLASHANLIRTSIGEQVYWKTPTQPNFFTHYAPWSVHGPWFLCLHLTTKQCILSDVFSPESNQQTLTVNLDRGLGERYGILEMHECCSGVDWTESCWDPRLQSKEPY